MLKYSSTSKLDLVASPVLQTVTLYSTSVLLLVTDSVETTRSGVPVTETASYLLLLFSLDSVMSFLESIQMRTYPVPGLAPTGMVSAGEVKV